MSKIHGGIPPVIGDVVDLDPLADAILKVDKLHAERHNLTLALSRIANAAKELLEAQDSFQLVCGSLTKDALVQSKFISSMQLLLAADAKNFQSYLNIAVLPFLDYVQNLTYEDLKKSAAKNAAKKRKGAEGFVQDVEKAIDIRDRNLWKFLTVYVQNKGKYFQESAKEFEKHKAVIETFDLSLSEPKESMTEYGKVIRRYPEDVRFDGEALILKVENVSLLSGDTVVSGLLLVTHYSMKLVTVEELDATTGNVRIQSQTMFNIPMASISRLERVDPPKEELVTIYLKDLQIINLSLKRSSRDADNFVSNIEHYLSMSVESSLFAFFSKESFTINGWTIYDPLKEFKRLRMPDDYIRISHLNEDYEFSPTYPRILLTPTPITDKDLRSAGSYRSKNRVITICWRDIKSWKVIARCSQPLVGLRNKSNSCDKTIIKALGEWAASTNETKDFGVDSDGNKLKPVSILDARPRINAVGNMANGGGYENVEEANLNFLGIENIHVVRDALATFRGLFSTKNEVLGTALRSIDLWTEKYYHIWRTLRQSNRPTQWFPMLQSIIAGAIHAVQCIQEGRSVIVHCSDGWDRTPQITSTAQLLLDGYYRTITGFAVLVEKEWLSFGHKFAERYGHGKHRTKYQDKQRSPIFIQWLDAIYQIISQRPEAFEFNSALLVTLADNLYSCRFGTFLGDNEAERLSLDLTRKTNSIWGYIMDNIEKYQNPGYEPAESPVRVHSNSKDFQLWLEYYIRWDQTLFTHPEADAEAIIENFRVTYSRASRKSGKSVVGQIPTSSSISLQSRSPKISILDSSNLEPIPDFSKWYDQMSVQMELDETKDFDLDDPDA